MQGTEKGSSGIDADGSEDGYSIVKGSVPMVDGLDVKVGYTMLNKALTTGERDQEEGTAYVKYSLDQFLYYGASLEECGKSL